MYKPDTDYTVTATFADGNSFARGVGDGIELAGGTVNYSDGTTGTTIDLPGWVPAQSGNDLVANGVGGSTGMNLFAAWGGNGRIQTAGSLGTIQSGGLYKITVMVGGPEGGPIGGPLAFHLLADGERLTPSEVVNPTLPTGGAFQEISRTYDATSIAGHIGASMTILLGVEDDNNLPNRVIFDNVSIEGVGDDAARFLLVITPNGPDYDLEWESQTGKLYNLRSSTDLTEGISSWALVESDIEATPPANTYNVARDGPRRFYAVEEYNAPPPPPIFSADFEADDGGFTVVTLGGTAWEHGAPNSADLGGGAVIGGNAGSANAWGTNLTGTYIAGTDTSLRSPVINLTAVTGAALSFARSFDAPADHTLEVNAIDAVTDTVIANIIPATEDPNLSSSAWEVVGPVAIPAAALGQSVRIEWRFIGITGDALYNGVYIDDVVVSPVP